MSKLGEWFRRGEVIKIAPDEQTPREPTIAEKEQMTWEILDRRNKADAALKKVLELAAKAKNNE